MDSQDHCISPGGKSHGAYVCTKCGWNYPNPHPSAKNRRAHKKICGTIKGFEVFDSDKVKQNLDFQKDHCLDDEQKTPSPRVVEKADEIVGDVSEEDVFTDAICEFSSNFVSDSFNEKEEIATNYATKSTKYPGESQQQKSSLMGCVMKSSEMVQESCEVTPVEVHEKYDAANSVEEASDNRQGGEFSTEGQSLEPETLFESSLGAQVIEYGTTISNVGLKTESKGNLLDISEAKIASALGRATSGSSWNDEVIYSDLEGPHGFDLEATSMAHLGEVGCIVNENVPVDTSLVKANAAQVICANQTVPENLPSVENADVSLHGIKDLEEFEENHSVNPCLPEKPEGEKCETDTLTPADNLRIQPEGSSIETEVPSSDKLLLEEKTEPHGQTALVVVKEFSCTSNIVISKIDPEDLENKAEEGESSFGAVKETGKESLPTEDPIVVDLNTDVSHTANKTDVVDLIGHENELIQANVVGEEGNSPNRKLSSESSCAAEKYVSPVSFVSEGDDSSDQIKSSTETSKDPVLQINVESYESNDEARRESIRGEVVEESSFLNVANTTEYFISHSGTTGTAPNDSVRTANQKSLESDRTEIHRVVGGLGGIQGNEIDSNDKAHNFYAEVPVTIESNDHRDFGRLQNLSEEHIRSLVSSPLVTRNNTSQAFESNLGTVSGLSIGVNKSENASHNQEITMERTTSRSTVKEQHVPLKNLLSEARSPKLQVDAKAHQESNIPRVSTILEQETSPPEDGSWSERREVSEEWNSPAKYPVDLRREERKVKGRPFWVPFVCCSSVN